MDWNTLRQSIKGSLHLQTDPGFLAVRDAMVWNAIKPNRLPDAIVTVHDDNDVVAAVNFARENGLQVAVHGGGHTWCGLAVRNGGITIDLSKLNACSANKAEKTALIQPVISNQDLAHFLGQYDLAFPIGHCPTVKASGYLLNGGMSWNISEWGPACLSIKAIEFVTADGKKITASSKEHPDLFWAARGCGPGMFAVATRYHLQCYALPKAIMTSTYFYSLENLRAVVDEVTQLGWTMPSMVELSIFLIKAPPELAAQCKKDNGKLCMISAVAFANTAAEGEAALGVLEKGLLVKKCLAKSINQASSFAQLSEVSGITWPENHRNLCENQCSNAKASDLLVALCDKFIDAPSDKSVIVFCQSTGQHNLLEPREDIALSMDASSYGGSWVIWEHEKDDAVNFKWQDEVIRIIKPFTSTHYIGETDIVQDNARVKESYTAEKWKKLEEIRAQYDPQGVFFGFLGGT